MTDFETRCTKTEHILKVTEDWASKEGKMEENECKANFALKIRY